MGGGWVMFGVSSRCMARFSTIHLIRAGLEDQ